MTESKLRWHFDVWDAFNHKVYKKTLTDENILDSSKKFFIEKVVRIHNDGSSEPDMELPVDIREFVKLSKNGYHYLLPIQHLDKLPLNVKKSIRCVVKKSEGIIHEIITTSATAKISGEKSMHFTDFIDNWLPLKHSSPKDWTLLKLLGVAVRHKGVKACVCSGVGAGKNANFNIIESITQDVVTTGDSTKAKVFHDMCYSRVLIMDEVTSMSKSDFRLVESAMIKAAAGKTYMDKHAMPVGKELTKAQVSRLSIIFTYNRPQDMGDAKGHFEELWVNPAAFKDRYPQLLLDGKIEDSLGVLSRNQSQKIMEENYDFLRSQAKQYVYWCDNIDVHVNGYDRKNVPFNRRHLNNIEGLIDVIDVYSKSQEEFDEWMLFLKKSAENYEKMIGEYL